MTKINPTFREEVRRKPLEDVVREPSIVESFTRGLNMYDQEMTSALKKKQEVDSLEDIYPDEPKLSPQEIKKKYDFDLPEPATDRQVILLMAQKKYYDRTSRRFAEVGFQLSDPLNFLAGWAGAALGTSADMFNIGADISLAAVGGPAAVGVRKFAQLSKFFGKYSKHWKTLRLAEAAKLANRFDPLNVAIKSTSKKASAILKSKFVRDAARAGAANSLVELGIHNVEASKGNYYDLGPALAIGLFAPAVLKGAFRGGKAFVKFSNFNRKGPTRPKLTAHELELERQAKTKIQQGEPITQKELEALEKADDSRAAAESIETKTDDLEYEEDPTSRALTAREAADNVETYVNKVVDDVDGSLSIRQLRTVDHADSIFGGRFAQKVIEMAANILESGHRLDIPALIPFINSKKAFNEKLAEVMKKRYGDSYKEHSPDQRDLDALFDTTEDVFEEYHKANFIPEPVVEKVEKSQKVLDVTTKVQELIDPNLEKPGVVGLAAQTGKGLIKAIDEFRACLAGGGAA